MFLHNTTKKLQQILSKTVWKTMWISCIVLAGFSPLVSLACTDDEPTSETTDETTQDSAPIGPFSTTIRLSELLPNPSTSETEDEYIELYNSGDESVDMAGWQLQDASGKTYTLSGTISAKHYYAWYRSDSIISLNNTGETVVLLQPDGTELDSVSYEDGADEDTSYALTDDDTWEWTTELTPYLANTFPTSVDTTEEAETTDTASNDEESEESSDEDAALPPSYEYSTDVALSELLPDPDGSDVTDEWIELYNAGETVDLYGWMLTDGGHEYVIDDSLDFQAGSYLTFPVTDTGISLNNSGETIQLYDPQNEVISEVEYPAAATGQSYALVNDTWQWTTTPTPAEANMITSAVEEVVTATTDDDDTVATTAAEDTEENGLSIAAVKQLASGETVTFMGVVLVLPDTYSSNYFYVQDETSGIQVYSSSKSFPTLAIGDVISITGKTSSSNGEAKINISSAEDLVVTDHVDAITPLAVDSYVAADAGRLVVVSGEVASKSGSTVVLDNDWNLYLKRGTDISSSLFIVGELVTVTGVLVSTDDAIQVWPRATTDISNDTAVTSVAAAMRDVVVPAAYASSDGQQIDLPISNSTPASQWRWLLWLAIAAGVIALSLQVVRVPWLKALVRNWIVVKAHAVAELLGQWVGSKKSTMDSNVQSQYRESRPAEKTTASSGSPGLPSAVTYVPIQSQR